MSTPPIDRTDGCLLRKLYPWCASCFVQQKRESSTIVCGQVTCLQKHLGEADHVGD